MTSSRSRLLVSSAMSLVVSTAGLTGCQSPTTTSVSAVPIPVAPAAGSAASASNRSSADDAIDRVLVISVDGLNPKAITQLGAAGSPAFHRLMREGAWTFNARTLWGNTSTLPNHTAMFTGRRIDVRRGGHGVRFDADNGKTVHQAAGHYVPSAFDVVHDHGGQTAMYSAKPKFAFYRRTWNTNGGTDRVGKDNGRAKIGTVDIDRSNTRMVRRLNAELKEDPATFTLLHFSLPDAAGHQHGFMGRQYVKAVQKTDALLGSVLDTVASQTSLRKHMLVVLTADHGGKKGSHGDARQLQNYRIPFMAWGPGVPQGRNLYALNPTLRDPGTARLNYRGKQPIRNGDVANLVTDVLDLPRVPGSEFNRYRTLDLFGR